MIFTVNNSQKIWETEDRCFAFDALQHKTFTCAHVITLQTTQFADLLTQPQQAVRNQTAGDEGNTCLFERSSVSKLMTLLQINHKG